MSTLDLSTPGELRLTLRGAEENTILATLRRWPYWLRAEVEHDPEDKAQCLAVTLITSRTQEATLREILRRSFGLTFPPEGGDTAMKPVPPPRSPRRGFAARRS
jgi:phage-related baseplate assembly protein